MRETLGGASRDGCTATGILGAVRLTGLGSEQTGQPHATGRGTGLQALDWLTQFASGRVKEGEGRGGGGPVISLISPSLGWDEGPGGCVASTAFIPLSPSHMATRARVGHLVGKASAPLNR